MEHNVTIFLRRAPPSEGIPRCWKVNPRKYLPRRLLGKKFTITLIVPGDSVGTVSITEVSEGGCMSGNG